MKQIKAALDIVYKITFLLDIYTTSAALPGPVHKWTARGWMDGYIHPGS